MTARIEWAEPPVAAPAPPPADDITVRVRVEQVAEIRGMLTKTGLCAKHLAVAAGLAPSTLSRPLAGSVAHAISATTMAKLRETVARLQRERAAA